MENCVLCSKKVSSGNSDSFSSDDGVLKNCVLKAEVTSRFFKTFERVYRMLNETDTDNGKLKSKVVETTDDGSISNLPTLCQECADKVQAVDVLSNLLTKHLSEIRTLLVNTNPREKIKYDRDFLLQIGSKKVEYFNVLEHGLPDLVPENTNYNWITAGLNDMARTEKFIFNCTKLMKTIDEKPKVSVRNPQTSDFESHGHNPDTNKIGLSKPRIQYDRDLLLRIGNEIDPKFFDTLRHGFPDLVRSYHLPKNQQNNESKPTEVLSKKPETYFTTAKASVNLGQVPVPVTSLNKPIKKEMVTNQPIIENQKSAENCPIEKLRELLADPKLSPKNFNTVAIHCMDIPSSNTQPVILMLLAKAIEMPEFSKKVSTLLHFILEKCEPNYEAMYRKFINGHFKLEIESTFSENPKVIQVKEQLRKEIDENICTDYQLELESLQYAFKRRYLNVVKLMGLLYKEKLVATETIVETINKFVIAAEDEKLECVCLLFTIVGEFLESDATVKAKWLKSQLSHLRQRAQGQKIRMKVRDLISNMLILHKNKWKCEGLSETDNATAMVFQKYSASATKSFENAINSSLFNFYFPGTEVGVFINQLCIQIAIKPNIGKSEDAGKLVRLLIANRNITKLETLLEISSALKIIEKDNNDQLKIANQPAEFLVEIFSEECNLDWLLICGKNIRQENQSFWKHLVVELFERLVFQTNEHYVRMAVNKTTNRAELLPLFEVWEERKIKVCSKQIEDLLRPKLEKGESLNDLQRVLRKRSFNPSEQITVARALIEAICTLSWNTSTSNWNDQKLKLLLPLLELPNINMLTNIWQQTESISRKLGIEQSALEQVWSTINPT